jgi:hypothetical protein
MKKEKLEQHWFKHNINASNNGKLIKLQANEGLEGYAVYWKLIELLYINEGRYEFSLDELAFTLRISRLEYSNSLIESVIKNYGLFNYDDDIFYSDRVIQGLADIYDKSKKATESANKRYSKKDEPKIEEEDKDEPEYIRKWNEEQERKRNNNGF